MGKVIPIDENTKFIGDTKQSNLNLSKLKQLINQLNMADHYKKEIINKVKKEQYNNQ